MGDVTRLCDLVSCRSEFVVSAPHQRFCSTECRHVAWNEQRRTVLRVGECERCGSSFETHISTKRFCSSRCQKGAEKSRNQKRKTGKKIAWGEPQPLWGSTNASRDPVACVGCGDVFLRNHASRKYCSDRCRERFSARRKREARQSRPCRINGCENAGVASSQLCPMHYYRRQKGIPMDLPKQKVRGRRQSETCTVEGCDRETYWLERCKRHYFEHHARLGKTWAILMYEPGDYRAKTEAYGGKYEPVDRFAVFARDNWICQLCGEPVDPDLKRPDVMSPTLDHIVPFVHGGDHSYENVQLAHLSCNSRKSDRVEV